MAFDLSHFDPIAGKFGLDPAAFRAALQHMWSGGGQSSGLGGGGNALGTPGGFQPNFPMMNGQPWWMQQQGGGGSATPGQPWWPQHSPGMPVPTPQSGAPGPNLLQRATGLLGGAGGVSGGSGSGGPLQTLSGFLHPNTSASAASPAGQGAGYTQSGY